MSIDSEVVGLKARANAAQQLARIADLAEPLSERQREAALLLLANAYMDGMIDTLQRISEGIGA